MALPKGIPSDPDNPHANGVNWEALKADPRVVVYHRPPGVDLSMPIPGIPVLPGTDVLELLGRRPYDEDDSDE